MRDGVSAVLPARNEARWLGAVLTALRPRVEVAYVVDDGSTDATAEVARAHGAVVISRARSGGVGAATARGLRAAARAGARIVVTLDADGQHDPCWIAPAVERLRESSADAVLAERFHSVRGVPITKRIANNLGWMFLSRIIGRRPITRDVSCGFRVYGPRALAALQLGPRSRGLGYAFVQSTYARLHAAPLRLVAIDVPAIYPRATGTPLQEMLQFLAWARTCGRTRDLAGRFERFVTSGRPFRFALTSWAAPHRRLRVAGCRRREEIVFWWQRPHR